MLEQVLDKVNSHFLVTEPGSRSSPELSVDLISLCEQAKEFQLSLDGSSPPEARLADAILRWLAARIKEGRIHEPSLRALCRDISREIEYRAHTPLGCLASEFPAALKALCADRPGLERDITMGMVDALLSNFLRSPFLNRADSVRSEPLHRHLATLSIHRPALAVAFGHVRLDHEFETRELGLAMDFLGERILEVTPLAPSHALRAVAFAITRQAETGGARDGGMTYWQLALAPYLLGSLRNKNPEAVVAVVEGVLDAIRECRQVREVSQAEGAHAPRTLNLDKVAATFMEWAAQAPPEQRNRVHMALAVSLAKMSAGSTPEKTDS